MSAEEKTPEERRAARAAWPVVVGRPSEMPREAAYWRARTPEERLAAVEWLRAQYNGWRYGAGQQLQRVYRIAQRA